jgi:DNA-binding LacI/PurR family transcriptional regulator
LRHQLEVQNFRPGEFVTTERTLAQNEGVNRLWIRRAVDVLVREGKLERRPGKGLYVREAKSATRVVQLVVPHLRSYLYSELSRAVKVKGRQAGWQIQIYDAHGNYDCDLEFLRRLPKIAAEGAIGVSLHNQHFTEILYELKAVHYPFVLIDEAPRDIQVPCVVADNYGGGYLVGRKLTALGHRRIGFVGFMGADTVRARLDGLRDAMADAGLLLERGLVKELNVDGLEDWPAEVKRATKEILSRPERPTALFFCNDLAAAIGHRVVNTMGLRMPTDISVVGFDGDSLGRLLTPTLASVRQPAGEMGALAMELLLGLIDGKSAAGCQSPVADQEFSDRGPAVAGEQRDNPGPDARRMGAIPTARRGGPAPARDGESEETGGGDSTSEGRGTPLAGEHRVEGTGVTEGTPSPWQPSRANTLHRALPVTWQDGESVGPPGGGDTGTGEPVTGERDAELVSTAF